MKIHLEEGLIHKELQLEDLPNEEWVDAFEFDGIYQVSNLGRIKSLQRECLTRGGSMRIVEEKILKQSVVKAKNGRIEGLVVSLKKSKTSANLIFKSFFPYVNFLENECVMHKNKNRLDNRLENLEKVTRKISKGVDMIKSARTIIATPKNIKIAQDRNKKFIKSKTHKECSKCGKVDFVENFPKNVSKCQNCVNDYVIKRRKNYKYSDKEKKCNKCGEVKTDIEFPKLNGTCKKCTNEAHEKYRTEQRETLGDWYIKQYGKYKYGYKDFSEKLMNTLRNELKNKHKLPKL